MEKQNQDPSCRDTRWGFALQVLLFWAILGLMFLALVPIYQFLVHETLDLATGSLSTSEAANELTLQQIYQWSIAASLWFLVSSPIIGLTVFLLSMGAVGLIRRRRKQRGKPEPGRIEALSELSSLLGVFLAIAGVFARPIVCSGILASDEFTLGHYEHMLGYVVLLVFFSSVGFLSVRAGLRGVTKIHHRAGSVYYIGHPGRSTIRSSLEGG